MIAKSRPTASQKDPQRDAKRSKIDQISTPRCNQILHPFWYRFLFDFGPILAPKMDPKWIPNRTSLCMCFRSRFWNFSKALLLKIHILIDVVKMQFLMQNPVFYRVDLISRLCKDALNSIADDTENRFGNQSKINEKSFQQLSKIEFFWK